MGKHSTSYDERNVELGNYDGESGRHGRLRLLKRGTQACFTKVEQEFHCLDCGAGSQGGWWMLVHNVHYGKGCPICASGNDLVRQVETRWPDYRLVMLAPATGTPLPEDIRYRVVPVNDPLPDSMAWQFMPLTRAAVTRGLRLDERPGRDQDMSYRAVVDVHARWVAVFGSEAPIRYAGKKKPGSTSPGPFFAIHTGSRRMRAPIVEPFVAAGGVLAICEEECRDRIQDASWKNAAGRFEATIVGYLHTFGSAVRIHYRNRFGQRREDTYKRATETNWGQTKMRKGENLCAIVLSLLFPADDWRSNSRPEFLTYCVDGKKPSRLELDGYSESRKLAFEYQGDHHYHARDDDTGAKLALSEIQARDAFKVDACPEEEITLLVVKEMDLDPQTFLDHILGLCLERGLAPDNPGLALDAVWEKWNTWCENPLARFQDKVMQQLNQHRLLAPAKEKIGKRTLVRYECSRCGEENETSAKHLKEGPVRQGCPQCRGKVAGKKRRNALLDTWRDACGLPAAFIDNLKANSTVGETRYVCDRDPGHVVVVHDMAFAQRHIIDGRFVCPQCETRSLGVDANLVALQRQWNQTLKDDLEALGLSVLQSLPPRNGQATALVRCRSGRHEFEVTRGEASAMLRNDCMNDRAIVPSACHACCYPVGHASATLLRSTVFHRLYILGGMYPRVSYVEGFDPTGWAEEVYQCGNFHADGSPHSSIRVSFRNLHRAAKRSPDSHWCVACGLESGQVVGGGKTLHDLVALMQAMRDEIGRHVQLPTGLSAPTVQLVSGPVSDKGEISTTGAYLTFSCGVPGHAAVTAKKDYYFNRAEGRGAGFCPACVKLTGAKKAPIPTSAAVRETLRMCVMRDDAAPSARKSARSTVNSDRA